MTNQHQQLWQLCQQWIQEQRINCAETIYQTDRVSENALYLIQDICKLVGYASESEELEHQQLKPVPPEYFTQTASTCFSKSYMGEGSYYCPDCDQNCGSVWLNDTWRPTKWQALCAECRKQYAHDC